MPLRLHSGLLRVCSAIALHARYAVPGTDIAYAGPRTPARRVQPAHIRPRYLPRMVLRRRLVLKVYRTLLGGGGNLCAVSGGHVRGRSR
eukprot:2741270-Rhodomonas_salina.4